MRINKKAIVDAQVTLLFAILTILLLIILVTLLSTANKATQEATRYSNVERAGGAQGAVLYQAGWLANSYAQYSVNQQPFILYATKASEQELEENINLLLANTLIPTHTILSVFVIREKQVVACEYKEFNTISFVSDYQQVDKTMLFPCASENIANTYYVYSKVSLADSRIQQLINQQGVLTTLQEQKREALERGESISWVAHPTNNTIVGVVIR